MQNEMGRKQLIAIDLRGVCLIYLAIVFQNLLIQITIAIIKYYASNQAALITFR